MPDQPAAAVAFQHHTWVLAGAILAVLLAASTVGFALRLKVGPAPHPVIDNLNSRIKAWWAMAAAIGLALFAGKAGVIVLFMRDRGVKDWGAFIEGHGGMLDRLDSVCFSAPIFFHLVRYWWT